jgi:hypothetical protein
MKQAVRLMMTAWSVVARRHAHLIAVVIAALFVSVVGGGGYGHELRSWSGTWTRPMWFIEGRLKPMEKITHPGLVTLDLRLWVPDWNTDCRYVTAKIETVGKIELHGEGSWSVKLVADSTVYSRKVEVVIPPNDTSGLKIDCQCANGTSHFPGAAAFFVAEGDSVKYFEGDPRGFDFPRTQVPIADLPPTGRRVKGEFPHSDSLYPIPEDTVELPVVTYHREDRSASEHATQDSLERSPLTEQRVQIISVDGQTLVRRRGETRFHPIESKTEGEWNVYWKKRYDSTVAANWNVTYDVWIDLHSPDDLAFAKGLIDSLMPTDTAGIYRAAINKGTINQLSERKISIRKWGANPNERKPVPTRHEKDKLNMAPKRDPTV